MKEKSTILVTCPKGASSFLRQEIMSLGLAAVRESDTGITTEGSLEDAMMLNLSIRTGQRVLLLVKEFVADGPDDLYEAIKGIEWERLIPADGYFSVTSGIFTSAVRDSMFANVRCKDAIADRFRGLFGKRPDSGPLRDRTVIHLHWKDRDCSIWLDTSGEPLSKRGYRKIPLQAPMQEALAASVILATGWSGERNLVNPMCGSGTLAIEAALIGLGKAPGLTRGNFGFMHLEGFDKKVWERLRMSAAGKERRQFPGRVIATDISKEAVDAARSNARSAGVDSLIEFDVCDYAATTIPGGGGVVVLNPEYGERMGRVESLAEVYRGIGDFFKKRCSGYKGYVFTGNLGLAKKIGLRSSRRILFYNGGIESRLLEFELYEGSRKKSVLER